MVNLNRQLQVVDASISKNILGLSFRRSLYGPEQAMIEWFLAQDLVRVPAGHRGTVFKEPRLPSGFPDLVIVIWKEAVALRWTSSRAFLTSVDLRLMHLLTTSGPQSEQALETLFPTYEESLERLAGAAMIRRSQRHWQSRSFDAIFAATEIVAVEAKMKEWKSALEQAYLNTWFASQSYILVPRIPTNSTLLQNAGELGLTVVAQKTVSCPMHGPGLSVPRSYVSWLFNDLAWRAARLFDER